MTITELITTETIEDITTQLWASVVPAAGALVASPVATSGLANGDEISAAVSISGATEGTVELICSPALGRAMASFMFRQEEEELDEAAVHDAVGELANIVGGNLKSLLPPPTTLSIPVVSVGQHVPAGDSACEVGFEFLAEPVLVRIHEGSLASA